MQVQEKPICIVPFSGGMVSIVTALHAMHRGFAPHFLYVRKLFPGEKDDAKHVLRFVEKWNESRAVPPCARVVSEHAKSESSSNLTVLMVDNREEPFNDHSICRFTLLAKLCASVASRNNATFVFWPPHVPLPDKTEFPRIEFLQTTNKDPWPVVTVVAEMVDSVMSLRE